jgi:hypothetical protein
MGPIAHPSMAMLSHSTGSTLTLALALVPTLVRPFLTRKRTYHSRMNYDQITSDRSFLNTWRSPSKYLQPSFSTLSPVTSTPSPSEELRTAAAHLTVTCLHGLRSDFPMQFVFFFCRAALKIRPTG